MTKKYQKYQLEFTSKAKENGFSYENIIRCLNYAEPIISKDFPVIYNTSHLGSLVGYNKNYLKRAAYYPSYFYRKFEILKENGNKRVLFEPLPSLKEIQNWILQEILYQKKVSKYAKGFVPGRGIKDHVKYHTKEPKVLTLDIKNFFGTIRFSDIEFIFKEMGYSDLISNLLAKLCYKETGLPQGSPTSPYLTNILLIKFDETISIYCRENNIKYTRYADDLAFSGEIKKTNLINLIKKELKPFGLKLNPEKTKIMGKNKTQIISGIIVNDKPQVPKRERNKIRNVMFYIKKFGLSSHIEKTSQTRENYLLHLIGKINYILSINPKDEEFIEYKKHLYQLGKEMVTTSS